MRFFVRVTFIVAMIAAAKAQDEESNPFVEAATALLQDHLQGKGGGGSGLAAVGGLVQSFIQSDGGRQISDTLLSVGSDARTGTGGTGDAPAADLLSGLGSLLATAAEVQGGAAGGLDAQLFGSVVNAFTSQMGRGDVDANNNVNVKNNEVDYERSKHAKKPVSAGAVDWTNVLNLAGNFLVGQQGKGGHVEGDGAGVEGLLNLLPLLLQSSPSSGEGANAGGRSSLFAPLLDLVYDYWNHFTKSELAQTLWRTSGLEATAKLFTDKDGYFDMDRIYRSVENASFRKRWIKNLSTYIADWVAHVSNPAAQKRFLSAAQFMGNNFLKTQGYSKAALFDPAKPAESLSRMVNAVFKRQFNLKVNSSIYIKPALSYLQEVYSLGQAQGISFTHLTSKEIEEKLTETINSEIIEPSLRVWRSYRYALKEPRCDKYVICFVNKRNDEKFSTGLKPGVTKLSSVIASWFLSGSTGTSFWDLYNAATEDQNCPVKYPVDCEDFHAEDIKATSEYAHSEL